MLTVVCVGELFHLRCNNWSIFADSWSFFCLQWEHVSSKHQSLAVCKKLKCEQKTPTVSKEAPHSYLFDLVQNSLVVNSLFARSFHSAPESYTAAPLHSPLSPPLKGCRDMTSPPQILSTEYKPSKDPFLGGWGFAFENVSCKWPQQRSFSFCLRRALRGL